MNQSQREQHFKLKSVSDGFLLGFWTVLEELGIPHGVTTRQGPSIVEIRDHPERVMPKIGHLIGCDRVAFLTQVHGGTVLEARGPGLVGQADALFTRQPGLVLAGKSADCPIVLMADLNRRMVGFAHASWRSTVAGIVPCLVERMVDTGVSPETLMACIAPSIGPECFEVGPEVREAAVKQIGPHAEVFFRPGPRRDHFDLWQANTDAMLRAGVRQDHIFCAQCCTVCHNDLYPSYRAEHDEAGRFVAAIALPPED